MDNNWLIKELGGQASESFYSDDGKVIGTGIGIVSGSIIGAVAAHKLNKEGRKKFKALETKLYRSYSKKQKELVREMEYLSEFLNNNTPDPTNSILIDVAAGLISNALHRKEKLRLHKLVSDYNFSLTADQSKLVKAIGKVSSANGFKTLAGVVGGAVICGIIGYKIGDKKY